jgi:hypothetical protein
MTQVDPVGNSGLSASEVELSITGGVDFSVTDSGLTTVLQEMKTLLAEIVGTARDVGASAAQIAAEIANERQKLADLKGTLVATLGKDTEQSNFDATEMAVQRGRLDTLDSSLESAGSTFSNIAKNQGTEASQQAISMIQKGIDIIDQMQSIAARK